MKTRTELIISLQNEVDLCFEAKKTRDNDGPPYSRTRLNCLVQKMFCRTQISDRLDPNTTRIKMMSILDRLVLLRNLTWCRAHVTAGLTGRDPNVNVNVLRCFR